MAGDALARHPSAIGRGKVRCVAALGREAGPPSAEGHERRSSSSLAPSGRCAARSPAARAVACSTALD
eukprot:322657-Alexandrium_andersonii.AAC.1